MTPDDPFNGDAFSIRRQFFALFSAKLHITNAQGRSILYARMPSFALKPQVLLYADAAHQQPLLRIEARRVFEYGPTYDVYNPVENHKVGVLRRNNFKSLVRDEWAVLNQRDEPVAVLREDSQILALFRRFVSRWLPQKHILRIDDQPIGVYKQHWNPVWLKISADFSADRLNGCDRRLGVALLVMLALKEGRQETNREAMKGERGWQG